jgi:hypothetical protein
MSKHTPGPWKVGERHYVQAYIPVVSMSLESMDGDSFGPKFRGRLCATVPRYSPRHEANATLIAAAPELLEALKLCVEWEQDYRTRNNLGKNPPQPFMQAIAAILKAEV